jgi:MFS family permease
MFGVLFSVGNPAIPLYTNSLGISGRFVGIYLASNGIGLLLFTTVWGVIGDIKDRHKVVAIVFIGLTVLIQLKKADVLNYRKNYLKEAKKC